MISWLRRKYEDYRIWLTYKTWADQKVTLLRLSGCSNISYKMKKHTDSGCTYEFDFWFTPPKVVEHVNLKTGYWDVVNSINNKDSK